MVQECGDSSEQGLASVPQQRRRWAGPGPLCSSLEQPAGPVGGLLVEMAKTDVRRGGEARSKQLKMGKKAREERRRRKEGEGS